VISFGTTAQYIQITVLDESNLHPVAQAEVANKRSKNIQRTDEKGNVNIDGEIGDTLFLHHDDYSFKKIIITSKNETVYLIPLNKINVLEEVEVKSDLAKFKKDSMDNAQIYRKMRTDINRSITIIIGFPGVSLNGGVSRFARWISGRQKREKRLYKMMINDEQQKFTALRYNNKTVKDLLKINDSLVQIFIRENPIPNDFARSASDLELKVWIREQYKKWKSYSPISQTPTDNPSTK